jgi:oxygen-independent coproporphyrinogen-3 oxidase
MTQERDADGAAGDTELIGNYFVANYPPFSCWRADHVPRLHARLAAAPAPAVPLGLYVHIPFCRKRCDFCFFRVYTDRDARAVRRYLDAVIAELALLAPCALLHGRAPRFVYFGGGTPSYLSVDQLEYLFAGLQRLLSWRAVEEVTFECEPGTLQASKLSALRRLGVTRLSLGVESFAAEVLARNNRAHRVPEIDAAYAAARAEGFPQINVDLIAGMVGETDASWSAGVARALALAPDSITIYQMEVPHNTTLARRLRHGDDATASAIPDWPCKRRWVADAFAAFAAAGYTIGSAYTASRGADVAFLYRDCLWHGADLLGLGVASFSHLGGVHAQNQHDFEPYVQAIERGELPVLRALALTEEERLRREFVLQLKLGAVQPARFLAKFGVDVRQLLRAPLDRLAAAGYLTDTATSIALTRPGLLRVDRLLPEFFLPDHRGVRYA